MSQLRILVVDDATTIRKFMRSLFEGAGYAVVEARDGNEGFEIALNETVDLAFVDINMPGLDGYSLVRKLREDPGMMWLPVVMCSTESKPIDEQRAYEAGANFYIRKPVRKGILLDMCTVMGGRA